MFLAAVLFEQCREEMTILREKNQKLHVNDPTTEIISSFENIVNFVMESELPSPSVSVKLM
jgi:hypothetical protein